MHFDEDHRRYARNTFGFNEIPESAGDVTSNDWDILGDMYMEGKDGHPKDQAEAIKWYRKAAEAGNSTSMNSLAIAYCEGKGVPKNYSEACKWFEKAAENGNPLGYYNLALRYLHGEGVPQSDARAESLLRKAAAAGVNGSEDLLGLLERKKHRYAGVDHGHYDLGWVFIGFDEIKLVEVTLNYAANVYLMDGLNYSFYKDRMSFNYYGGKTYESPYRIKIPFDGEWHVVIDNDDDDLGNLRASCSIRTISGYY